MTIPWFVSVRLFGNGINQRADVKAQAAYWLAQNITDGAPMNTDDIYLDGWGTVGFPPVLAANAAYTHSDGTRYDLGRFVAGQERAEKDQKFEVMS